MDKQFSIYSINFRAFYTDEEMEISNKILKTYNQMTDIEKYYNFITKYNVSEEELILDDYLIKVHEKDGLKEFYKRNEEQTKDWKNHLRKLTISERKKATKDKQIKENRQAKKKSNQNELYNQLKQENKNLVKQMNKLLEDFKGVRQLREDMLKPQNVIQIFSNSLSRTMDIEYKTKVSKDIICITISNYSVMNQLINNGFIYYDKELNKTFEYIVLTSSAGQIRKKKIIFIKKELMDKYKYSIMCGLSIDRINSMGGMNINKFLSYLALQNSATDVMTDFNIDECIVVDDFETTLKNKDIDFIEKKTLTIYNKEQDKFMDNFVIKNPIRTKKDITINHSDGCGLTLVGNKSFQIRLPFVKGLMTPVNYLKFCEETKGASTKIVDLWGKEWDVKKDNIKYILTKSQFKMHKFYKNIYVNEGDKEPFIYGWEVYKACFKAYSCQACYCNMEESKFKKGQFNYQYWQTLTDVSDEEIEHFTKPIVDKINKCHYDIKTMLSVFGADEINDNSNIEKKILHKYPPLLKDFHFKDSLSNKLSKIKKEAKCGKFKTNSINTFLIPDVYAWMEYLFCGIKEPNGILDDGEVICNYFKSDELLLDRSPHLYLEHAVRKNIAYTKNKLKYDNIKKYFKTNGVYTSTKDLISKILQFDVDGDHSLVTDDKILIDIVKRNVKAKDIVPLYYDLGQANAELITNQNIINSLKNAFKYGNIGTYSNKITNLWNCDEFTDETLTLIKLLTAINNYSIDSAKTLEMVELDLDERIMYKNIMKIANGNMPYFFQFAKNKPNCDVNAINNSTVNRICKNIEKVNNTYAYNFDKVGRFNSTFLYSKKTKEIDITNEKARKIIECFEELDKIKNHLFRESIQNNQEKAKSSPAIYNFCIKKFKENLRFINVSFEEASDIVIKYYFTEKKNKKKTLLFIIFGENILNNLEKNINDKNYNYCNYCGCKFTKIKPNQKYCSVECRTKNKKH